MPATTTTEPDASLPVAVLPIGSCEQHGPYLPLATDTLIASAIAAAISEYHQLRQLPPITISCSHEHAAFPGTLSISATTLGAIVTDIADSLTEQGAAGLVIVNAHGGNAVLTNIVQQGNTVGPLGIGLYPSREEFLHDPADKMLHRRVPLGRPLLVAHKPGGPVPSNWNWKRTPSRLPRSSSSHVADFCA